MADPAHYEGASGFLRWWPPLMVGFAFALVLLGWPKSAPWVTLLVALAALHSFWVPWRFVIGEDGLALTFPFGRHTFLPKRSTSIRIEYTGAFALVGSHRRFGYPLHERFLYEPDQRPRLRRAFVWFDFDVSG